MRVFEIKVQEQSPRLGCLETFSTEYLKKKKFENIALVD